MSVESRMHSPGRYLAAMPSSHGIGAKLREIRGRAKLSQDDAARRVGVKPLTWSRWEREASNLDDDAKKRIMEAFNVPPDAVGYEPPRGWELVPAAWIRERFDHIDAKLDRLTEREGR